MLPIRLIRAIALILMTLLPTAPALAGEVVDGSLEGYTLFVAAEFPNGPEKVVGKVVVKGDCSEFRCLAGNPDDSGISLDKTPAVWGKLTYTPNGPVKHAFSGLAWSEFGFGSKFNQQRHLKSKILYRARLSMYNIWQHTFEDIAAFKGAAVWAFALQAV